MQFKPNTNKQLKALIEKVAFQQRLPFENKRLHA